jgi:hypothetical protein
MLTVAQWRHFQPPSPKHGQPQKQSVVQSIETSIEAALSNFISSASHSMTQSMKMGNSTHDIIPTWFMYRAAYSVYCRQDVAAP